MKRRYLLGFFVCFTLYISACSNHLTLKFDHLSESKAGKTGEFFVNYLLSAEIPTNYMALISMEKITNGKSEVIHSENMYGKSGSDRFITFGINIDENEQVSVRFGSSDLLQNFTEEEFSGEFMSGSFIDQSVNLLEAKSTVLLAYWYGGSTNGIENIDSEASEVETIHFLEQQELAYILQVDLVEVVLE